MTRSVTTQRRALRGLGNGLLVLMLLWTAIPFYWMIATSLKHDKEIYGYEATLIPQNPTLANYATVFRETPYLLFLRNSMVVAIGSTIVSIAIACLGAYAIARLNFPGRAALARGMVFTYLVPTSLLFIPMFAMMSALRLTDSLHGLIIAYLGFDVPFCAWLLMGYFKSVPVELEEAARVGRVQPDQRAAASGVAHVTAGPGRGHLLLARTRGTSFFTPTCSRAPIAPARWTTGLATFMSQDVFFWGPLMASTVMSALPPFSCFSCSSAGWSRG